MARWDVRDLLGHYTTPRSAEYEPCPHLCCRNRRVHPDNLPVVLDKKHLRTLSEPQLVRHLQKYAHYSHTHPKAFGQVVAEVDRRERAERTIARSKHQRVTREQEHRDEVYRQYLQAEAATNGYMTNRTGRAAGVDPISLFTGNEDRARKYASRELLDWFSEHGRPTRVSMLGSAKQRRESRSRERLSVSY